MHNSLRQFGNVLKMQNGAYMKRVYEPKRRAGDGRETDGKIDQ